MDRNTNTGIVLFLGLSTLLHAGAFVSQYLLNPPPEVIQQQKPLHLTFTVIRKQEEVFPDIHIKKLEKKLLLVENNPEHSFPVEQKQDIIEKPEPEPEPEPKPVPAKTLLIKNPSLVPKTGLHEESKTSSVKTIQVKSSEPSDETKDDEQNKKAAYLAYLYQLIEKNKYYPAKARRWRAEGKVVLSFSINASGLISKLEVLQSSSNRHLDGAAKKIIQKIQPLKKLPEEIIDKSWSLKVPIEYQLQN